MMTAARCTVRTLGGGRVGSRQARAGECIYRYASALMRSSVHAQLCTVADVSSYFLEPADEKLLVGDKVSDHVRLGLQQAGSYVDELIKGHEKDANKVHLPSIDE